MKQKTKKLNLKILAVLIITSINLLISTSVFSQAVGISGDFFTPDSSAILEIQSTKKGVLFPRMTEAQRDSISDGDYGYNAELSLVIYNTTTDCFEFYAYGKWHELSCYNPCGGKTSFIDSRDSKEYKIVGIGTQCWMAENLAYLPEVHKKSTFKLKGDSSKAAYAVYGYDGSVVATAKAYKIKNTPSSDSIIVYSTYGVLYNWWGAMAGGSSCNGTGESHPACSTPVQGACPSGWHLPSHYEFTELERAVCSSGTCATDFLYDESTIGTKGTDEGSKLAGNKTLWDNDNLEFNLNFGTSGFSVLPGGALASDGSDFYDESTHTSLWSSTETGAKPWYRSWCCIHSCVSRDKVITKKIGFSVRCVRD